MKRRCLILLLLSTAIAFADVEPLGRDSLEVVFQSIGVDHGPRPRLQLRFKGSGARFLLFRDGKEDKVSDYNETVVVKLGEDFTLTEQHGSLEFAPLPRPLDQHGWLVSLNFDARSFGGKETSRYAILLILHGAELRFVQPDPTFDPKLPPTDSTHQRIIKLIAETPPPVVTTLLYAETPAGRANPPFPVSTAKLVLDWKLVPGARAEIIEARWIATDIGAAAPNDYLISSSKSEAGKTEGTFTLSKPTAGFPPGKYRLELRQMDQLIYSEEFTIR